MICTGCARGGGGRRTHGAGGPPQDDPTRILLVGRTGAGKSTLANALIGTHGEFEVGHGNTPGTITSRVLTGELRGRPCIVADTRGLYDNYPVRMEGMTEQELVDLESERETEEDTAMRTIRDAVWALKGRVNICFLVVNASSPHRDSLRPLKDIKDRFGEGILDRVVVVVSNPSHILRNLDVKSLPPEADNLIDSFDDSGYPWNEVSTALNSNTAGLFDIVKQHLAKTFDWDADGLKNPPVFFQWSPDEDTSEIGVAGEQLMTMVEANIIAGDACNISMATPEFLNALARFAERKATEIGKPMDDHDVKKLQEIAQRAREAADVQKHGVLKYIADQAWKTARYAIPLAAVGVVAAQASATSLSQLVRVRGFSGPTDPYAVGSVFQYATKFITDTMDGRPRTAPAAVFAAGIGCVLATAVSAGMAIQMPFYPVFDAANEYRRARQLVNSICDDGMALFEAEQFSQAVAETES